jgi:dipeptide/tripeptide permease
MKSDVQHSLHYVDGDGRPLQVRGLYRFWVVSFWVAAIFCTYAAVASVPGFIRGAWAGAAVTAVLLAAGFGLAWISDRRHSTASRQEWADRNTRTANLMAGLGSACFVLLVVALLGSLHAGHVALAGFLLAPAVGAALLAALGIDARRRQQRRRATAVV